MLTTVTKHQMLLLPRNLLQVGIVNHPLIFKRNSSVLNFCKCVSTTFNGFYLGKCFRFKKHCNRLSTNIQLYDKLFIQSENAFAHAVLENNPLYTNTIVQNDNIDEISDEEFENIMKQDWKAKSPEHIFQAFSAISQYSFKHKCSITDESFDNLCESVRIKCKEMTDSDLIGVLASLQKWPQTESINSRNYGNIWSALDKECVLRIKQWDLNRVLFVADHWYKLYLSTVCDFMWHCNWKLGRKPSRLSATQLVQCMFYINVYRKIHPGISMYEFEYSLEKCVDSLSIDELAILAMGFFKSQTKIRSANLLEQILERTSKEVSSVSDITLSAILKVIRYSLPASLKDKLYHLLDQLVCEVDRLSLICCLHIALVGTHTLVFHEDIFKNISQRYCNEIKNVRLKDLERLAFALTLFNYDPKTEPCIFSVIVKELQNEERIEEFARYPKCVIRCLHYLTLGKIYPKALISTVLHPSYILNTYGKNMYHVDRAILWLDASVEIECADYDGNRIEPKLRHFLAKKHTHWLPESTKKNMNATDRILVEVIESCKIVLHKAKYFYAGMILPHFDRADIVFCVTSDGQLFEVPETITSAELSAIKYPPVTPADGQWYSLVVCGWNSYISGTDKLLGSASTKLQHLQIIGYTPIVIPWYEWTKTPPSLRDDYLKSKIPALKANVV